MTDHERRWSVLRVRGRRLALALGLGLGLALGFGLTLGFRLSLRIGFGSVLRFGVPVGVPGRRRGQLPVFAVVRHVKASALEVQRRRGNQSFHFAAAAFVYRQDLIGKLLPDLEFLPDPKSTRLNSTHLGI